MSQKFETKGAKGIIEFNIFLLIRGIVKQRMRHLLVTSSSSDFFNKTHLEHYVDN